MHTKPPDQNDTTDPSYNKQLNKPAIGTNPDRCDTIEGTSPAYNHFLDGDTWAEGLKHSNP